MRVERRNHEAGARNRHDHVDVGGEHVRVREAAFGRAPAQLYGVLLVLAGLLSKAARLNDVLDRKNRVPLVYLSVVDHRHHRVQTRLVEVEDSADVRLDVCTFERVRRYSGGSGGNRRRAAAFARAGRPVAIRRHGNGRILQDSFLHHIEEKRWNRRGELRTRGTAFRIG